ncbi:ASST-domain-containing protein [Aspergillus cavernicola]|uniref:ASST-domain-containing protein n=1 Tax=Aspergillus cavernicola TaxID=176166 RepID=A0ABR4IA10_9EURO
MLFSAFLLSLAFGRVFAEADNDDDLMSFVTLPKLRALKFDIAYHDREAVAPGYWFVAPYGIIDPEVPTKQWKPCQVGPYIYDADGILVWAGSCMFDNRNVFDFKAANNIDGESHLSFILQRQYQDDGTDKGYGYVLDQHYEQQYKVGVVNDLSAFNMHEFNVLDGGKSALACLYKSQNTDLSALGRPEEDSWIVAGGLLELDTKTGEILFEWSSFNNVLVNESVKVHTDSPASGHPGWDYIHVNSADKNSVGDYLLSGRFASTVYYISKEGEIVWRLGGKLSDFDMDFTFSKQHHARFVESNGTHHLISIMNNASDEGENEEDVSSALYVQIDTTASPMTATVAKRINRPDGGLTRLRGNVQALPNGNTFVGWSERGYQSEHDPDGKLLMEAKFASTRFSSYRSYKYPFTGRPKTPPDVVSSVYGTDETDLTTIFHVSWNGATDIASWKFYARSADDGVPVPIGNTTKTDFETMYIAGGYLNWVSVEAVDKDGNVLGTSEVHQTQTPSNWRLAGFQSESQPQPDNPSITYSTKEEEEEEEKEEDMEDMDMEMDTDSQVDPEEAAKAVVKAYEMVRGVGGFLIFLLVACSLGGLLAGIYYHLRRRRARAYYEVPSDEAERQPMAST